MAHSNRAQNAATKVVTLVHPDGSEYGSNSPIEINRLVYGQGYTFRDVPSYDEALAFLGDEAAVTALPDHPAPSGAVTLDDAAEGADGASTD